jgi:hypothetical protein
MRNSFVIILIAITSNALAACFDYNSKVENICMYANKKDTAAISACIKNFITKHKKEIEKSVPKFQPLVKWLKDQDCIKDITPPEGILESLPTYYSIYFKLITIDGSIPLCINVQEGEIKKTVIFKQKANKDAFLFTSLSSCPQFETQLIDHSKIIIASATKSNRSIEYPILPELSNEDLWRFYQEEVKMPEIKEVFMQLDSTHRNTDWFNAIRNMENKKAIFHLSATLSHHSDDVKIEAMKALYRVGNKDILDYLINVAKTYAVYKEGSESATIHVIYQRQIINTLNKITGVEVIYKQGDEVQALIRGQKLWKK